ncbi:MAG: DNA polymerase III subunit delta' C-terminal domain-containing protein [Arsenophonus sp.]
MNWYPWLKDAYKQIISFHQKKKAHPVLLLHTHSGIGSDALIYAISRWLMCHRPIDIKSCGKCHSCKLMLAETHLDWHKITLENGKNIIGIENIRYLIEILVTHAQHGGAKVIWFPSLESLSESASNALLKTLEEPTDNTYFLLECRNPSFLLDTLRSRCFYYHLSIPDYKSVVFWLQKQKSFLELLDIETAIKLNVGAPLSALSMLQPENWLKRKRFCQLLLKHLTTKTLFNWLPELDQPNTIERIRWLITLLLDAVKYKQQAINYCVNKDQLILFTKLATMNSTNVLLKSATEWKNCRYKLISIIGLNQKLQLTSQLINWQNRLYNNN